MRLTKAGWGLVTAMLVIIGALAFLFLQGNGRDRKLADGSTLRLEKIVYGKPVEVSPRKWSEKAKLWVEQFRVKYLHKARTPFTGGSSAWWVNTTVHTNDDALYLYFTRLDATTGDYADLNLHIAQIVDEHGCVFNATQSGGSDDGLLSGKPSARGGGYSVGWFRFEAFPRHEKKFRLLIPEKKLAEFVVQNPAPRPADKHWNTEEFPITRKHGDVTFTLARLKVKAPSKEDETSPLGLARFSPTYEVVENAKPSKNWEALDEELYDSSGNFASHYGANHACLCTQEPAWKLSVRFFGSERSPAASNAVWTLPGIEVPTEGKTAKLAGSNMLDGVSVKAIAFAGPGEFVYSNDVPIEAGPMTNNYLYGTTSVQQHYGRGGTNVTKISTTHAHMTWLLAGLGNTTPDQRWTVRATDERGSNYYAVEMQIWENTGYLTKKKPAAVNYLDALRSETLAALAFDLPAEVKKVDLTFCVHHCTTAEYIFKPPPVESRKNSTASKH